MKNPVFTGAGVAIITPMYEDGSINFDELGRIVEDQIARGTDAIVICGTTGECSTMTDEEQLAAIKYTVDLVNHRVPVIAGAGSNDTDHGCALAAKSAACGADALLLVTPYYNKTSQAGLVAHFTAMAEAGGIPVILYNVPSRTGLHIANRCYVEICHPDTGIPLKDGEVGEIVVTSFNKTYPLIRLATGDLSYIDRSPCPCGRTSPRLGSIVGRVDTTARISGMFVYPHQVEQVMSRFEEIKRWQIVVTNPDGIDEMTLNIEASEFKRRDELLQQFREKIKLRPELKVLAPGSLPPQVRPIDDKRHWD